MRIPDVASPQPNRARHAGERIWLAMAATLVLGIYYLVARPGTGDWTSGAATSFYGWQTEAYMQGHLYLPIEPARAMLALSDPYDPAQNAPWRLLDASLYRGRYYSYFSAVPTVLLLIPWKTLTGTFLTEASATFVFMALAFLFCTALLIRFRSRYFPDAATTTLVSTVLACGLGNLGLTWMHGAVYYQVAMACAYCCLVAALYFALEAGISLRHGGRWLAASSLACGLAMASRPNLVFASVLLVPAAWQACVHATGVRRRTTVLLAAGLPLAGCLALVMIHNWVRFDSPFEFGMSYQLGPVDFRHQKWISAGNIGVNLPMLLWGPAPLWRYYPFIAPSTLAPLGMGFFFPITVAMLGLGLIFRAGREAWLAVLPPVLAALAVLIFLSTYFTLWLRYEVEALLVITLAAVLIGLGLDHVLKARLARMGWRLAIIGAGGIGVATTLLITNPDWLSQHVARLADLPAYAWEKFRGTEFGTLKLDVLLPRGQTGRHEPLVATGLSHKDAIFVEYSDEQHIRIGFYHAGTGILTSPLLKVDYAVPQRIEIDSGAFCPPPEHPMYRGWPLHDIERVRHRLEVRLDGQVVMQNQQHFHTPAPGEVRIAASDPGAGSLARVFTGKVLQVSQARLARPPATKTLSTPSGAVAIDLQLPAFAGSQRLPLVSTGVTGKGDLIYLEFMADGRLRFGHDNWGGGLWLSAPQTVEWDRLHRLVVQMAPLIGVEATGPEVSPLYLIWDGDCLINVPRRFNPSRAENNHVGLNEIHASTAAAFFTGHILRVTPLTPAAWQAERRAARDITVIPEGRTRLGVRFTRTPEADAEPLVVTGIVGQADFVFVRMEADGKLRFGIDHWGEGAVLSESVAVDFSQEHVIDLEMQSLYPAGTLRPPYGLKLLLDGREVLSREGACHVATRENIWVGLNPVGTSSCSSRFSGEIRVLSAARPRE